MEQMFSNLEGTTKSNAATLLKQDLAAAMSEKITQAETAMSERVTQAESQKSYIVEEAEKIVEDVTAIDLSE
jgi:hypothetical protein